MSAVTDVNAPSDICICRLYSGMDVKCFHIVVQVWNTSTCEFVRTLNGHKRGIACLQYRDRLVVSGSSDNTIRYLVLKVLSYKDCGASTLKDQQDENFCSNDIVKLNSRCYFLHITVHREISNHDMFVQLCLAPVWTKGFRANPSINLVALLSICFCA